MSGRGGLRIALAGASGALAREVLTVLDERRLPVDAILPFASERSIVSGFCGTKLSVPAACPVAIGEQPAACAPNMRVCGSSINPSVANSVSPLWILVNSEPEAIGTTQASGARQPSCSATSKPSVRDPSA